MRTSTKKFIALFISMSLSLSLLSGCSQVSAITNKIPFLKKTSAPPPPSPPSQVAVTPPSDEGEGSGNDGDVPFSLSNDEPDFPEAPLLSEDGTDDLSTSNDMYVIEGDYAYRLDPDTLEKIDEPLDPETYQPISELWDSPNPSNPTDTSNPDELNGQNESTDTSDPSNPTDTTNPSNPSNSDEQRESTESTSEPPTPSTPSTPTQSHTSTSPTQSNRYPNTGLFTEDD